MFAAVVQTMVEHLATLEALEVSKQIAGSELGRACEKRRIVLTVV